MSSNGVSTAGIWTAKGFEITSVPGWRGHETTIVKTIATGVCGTDLHVLRDDGRNFPFPISLGHEILAEVVRVSTTTRVLGGDRLSVGDRVVVVPDVACGDCVTCLTYGAQNHLCDNKQVHGFSRFDPQQHSPLGGFSTFIELIDGVFVQKIPNDMPTERAVLGEVLAVAIRATERGLAANRADVGLGALVNGLAAVIGLGPIGCCVALTLQSLGFRVIGFDRNTWRTNYAYSKLDIDTLAVYGEVESTVDAAKSIGKYGAFDLVVECAGEPNAFGAALEIVRKEGKVVVLGHYISNGLIAIDPSLICRKDIEVIGSGLTGPISYLKAIGLLSTSPLPFERLVTDRLPLAEIGSILPLRKRGQYMKAIVVP
jgi:threonine dehydrogenase-like Zn-dependent dehydrogenase